MGTLGEYRRFRRREYGDDREGVTMDSMQATDHRHELCEVSGCARAATPHCLICGDVLRANSPADEWLSPIAGLDAAIASKRRTTGIMVGWSPWMGGGYFTPGAVAVAVADNTRRDISILTPGRVTPIVTEPRRGSFTAGYDLGLADGLAGKLTDPRSSDTRDYRAGYRAGWNDGRERAGYTPPLHDVETRTPTPSAPATF